MNAKRLFMTVIVIMGIVALSAATAAAQSAATLTGTTRHYYIAAESVVWDFAPSNRDLTHGGPIPDPWTDSHVFNKVRYIEYMDSSFTRRKAQPEWLGVLGPIIRAEVGDTVKVHFRNRADGFYGIHPHGFRYTKDNEGAHYIPAGAGSPIPPGGSYT